MSIAEKETPILVTTAHRGVFFGYFDSSESAGEIVTLTKARNVLYWSEETKGFMGLASMGPMPGSRVGPSVESLRLHGVTAVLRVSDEAVKCWESAPWN